MHPFAHPPSLQERNARVWNEIVSEEDLFTGAQAALGRGEEAQESRFVDWSTMSRRSWPVATIDRMADQTTTAPLDQQLDEIGAQLAWVRDYL